MDMNGIIGAVRKSTKEWRIGSWLLGTGSALLVALVFGLSFAYIVIIISFAQVFLAWALLI